MVVFIIDDTASQRNLHADLNHAFSQLIAKHRNSVNVRVAALVHGELAYVEPPVYRLERFQASTLGRVLSPDLLGGFNAPGSLSPGKVSKAINALPLRAYKELLYPAISYAMGWMTHPTMCGYPLDLSKKPWCQRKVIVVLGDGRPGQADDRYFHARGDELPNKLMEAVRHRQIELHTLCLGVACTHQIIRHAGTRFYYDMPTCPPLTTPPLPTLPPTPPHPTPPAYKCLGYQGIDIMKEIAKMSYNGGRYYGSSP